MATLKSPNTGKKIILKSYHVVGRNKSTVSTFLPDKDVSQIHASFRWNGEQWEITDHSRNGTWVNNHRLTSGKSNHLQKGNTIRFGTGKESSWKLVNIEPPAAALVALQNDAPPIELTRFQAFPNEHDPELSIFIADTGQWVCENKDGATYLKEGDIVPIGTRMYQFSDSGPIDSTLEEEANSGYFPPEKIDFHFSVSLDEEHVFLTLLQDNKISIDLAERVHHYLLLTLARQRLEDAKNGDDPSSQGWIEPDQLAAMLGIESEHLNIQIYRARKQLSNTLPGALHLSRLVERRVGGVRFGYTNFQIVRGSEIEGRMLRGKILTTAS